MEENIRCKVQGVLLQWKTMGFYGGGKGG